MATPLPAIIMDHLSRPPSTHVVSSELDVVLAGVHTWRIRRTFHITVPRLDRSEIITIGKILAAVWEKGDYRLDMAISQLSASKAYVFTSTSPRFIESSTYDNITSGIDQMGCLASVCDSALPESMQQVRPVAIGNAETILRQMPQFSGAVPLPSLFMVYFVQYSDEVGPLVADIFIGA